MQFGLIHQFVRPSPATVSTCERRSGICRSVRMIAAVAFELLSATNLFSTESNVFFIVIHLFTTILTIPFAWLALFKIGKCGVCVSAARQGARIPKGRTKNDCRSLVTAFCCAWIIFTHSSAVRHLNVTAIDWWIPSRIPGRNARRDFAAQKRQLHHLYLIAKGEDDDGDDASKFFAPKIKQKSIRISFVL